MTSSNSSSNPATDSSDEILVCLAHGPLPKPLLEKLLDHTAALTRQLQEQHQQQIHSRNHDPSLDQQHNLHMIVTGSTIVGTPGKELPEWQHQWSAGEKILAQIIARLGLNAFGAGRMLHARLLDIDTTSQEQVEAQETQQDANEAPTVCVPNLALALHELCRYVQRRQIATISNALFVVPVTGRGLSYYYNNNNNNNSTVEVQHAIQQDVQRIWKEYWQQQADELRL